MNRRDLAAGGLIIAIGLGCLAEASGYRMGTLRNMGPGFFPMAIGGVLVALGLAIAFRDGLRGHAAPAPEATAPISPRAVIILPASVLVFAATIRPLGLAPATFLAVLVSTLADPRIRPAQGLVTALAVTAICLAVFVLGLGIQVRAFAWWN